MHVLSLKVFIIDYYMSSCDPLEFIIQNGVYIKVKQVFKGAMSRFVHLEKISLIFSSSSFAIRVNLLHP